MSDRIRITKIELTTRAGKTVPLSLDEARDLHTQLTELFGPKHLTTVPVIIERDAWFSPRRTWRPWWYDITYSDSTEYQIPRLTTVCDSSGLTMSYSGEAID